MKHGPITLIDDGRLPSNLAEVRARDGHVIAVATKGDETLRAHCQNVLWVEDATALLRPLLRVLLLQLLAYSVAVARGTDVDQPRNLAKSVTGASPSSSLLEPFRIVFFFTAASREW